MPLRHRRFNVRSRKGFRPYRRRVIGTRSRRVRLTGLRRGSHRRSSLRLARSYRRFVANTGCHTGGRSYSTKFQRGRRLRGFRRSFYKRLQIALNPRITYKTDALTAETDGTSSGYGNDLVVIFGATPVVTAAVEYAVAATQSNAVNTYKALSSTSATNNQLQASVNVSRFSWIELTNTTNVPVKIAVTFLIPRQSMRAGTGGDPTVPALLTSSSYEVAPGYYVPTGTDQSTNGSYWYSWPTSNKMLMMYYKVIRRVRFITLGAGETCKIKDTVRNKTLSYYKYAGYVNGTNTISHEPVMSHVCVIKFASVGLGATNDVPGNTTRMVSQLRTCFMEQYYMHMMGAFQIQHHHYDTTKETIYSAVATMQPKAEVNVIATAT